MRTPASLTRTSAGKTTLGIQASEHIDCFTCCSARDTTCRGASVTLAVPYRLLLLLRCICTELNCIRTDLLPRKSPADCSPAHKAASNGPARTLKMLLDKGADVKVVNADGWSALHLAARAGAAGMQW